MARRLAGGAGGGYEAEHARLVAEPRWMMDGLGRLESLAARFARASEIVLIVLPLWMHFWLAAERQIVWTSRIADSASLDRAAALIPRTSSPGTRPGDNGCYRGVVSPGCPRRGARC